ncbi:MAG: right-handed parallel beta-helix repeat-containing protein [Planctomycetaceae bacterium]|nr:right-handed parallel beta-helix repeat-containing protein [Planctomycetaceae bacterium]
MKTMMATNELRRKIVLSVLFLLVIVSPGNIALADPNSPNPAPVYMAYGDVAPDFDPNAYSFLVYDCGTDNLIQSALPQIGIEHFTLRTPSNPVTANDLAAHNILVVSWNAGGDTSGLDPNLLQAYITGRVFLTGHDLDYHTVRGTPHDQGDFQPADIVLSQAIEFVLAGGGTGLVGLTDSSTLFNWLPSEWGIAAAQNGTEQIQSFTDDGIASGVFDGVEPADMSGWSQSYHNTFTAWGDGFTAYETGATEHVVTIAAPINPMGFDFHKYDDIPDANCVNIDDPIEYTITWDNTTDQTFYNCYIRDIFPAGVTYPVEYFMDPNTYEITVSDPNYQADDHTYIFPIGTIYPDDSGVKYLEVIVNDLAEPGYYLRNVAELWATVYDPNGQNPVERLIATARVDTLACCWDTNGILYVDENANGTNTGVSWQNAYTDLQDALTRARTAHCAFDYTIYVAQGAYSPGDDEGDSFDLSTLPGIELYGGFPTGGCDFSLRNPKRYQTILSGKIDETHRNETILRMGNNTYVEGFTIKESSFSGQGLYGCCGDFTVINCKIDRNAGYGAFIEDANATFKWCNFRSNRLDGIRHTGENKSLLLENVSVRQSGRHGVFSTDSTPTILNSILLESDMTLKEGRAGLMMENPSQRPYLQNLTCAHNFTEGIALAGTNLPEIYNSIVFHNGGEALAGFSADDTAMYSCIEDANSINGNIAVDPQFAYFDPNNVRLSAESDCRHASAPLCVIDYSDQQDMDGNPRVGMVDTPPDMGAYEMVCDINVGNPTWDWNADGLVNLVEWNTLATIWKSHDPNDPLWADPNVAAPNLSEGWYEWKYQYNYVNTGASQYAIDLADLLYWIETAPYLWKACWVDLEEMQMQQIMGGGEEMLLMTEELMLEGLQSWPEPELVQPEPTIEEQVLQLQDAVAFLEQIWLEEPDLQQQISAEDWQAFMDAVYQNLLDLQAENLQLE